MESSRRAAQLGLGAAVLLLLACLTLIVAGSVRADTFSETSSSSAANAASVSNAPSSIAR